jgi:hypothetical protein
LQGLSLNATLTKETAFNITRLALVMRMHCAFAPRCRVWSHYSPSLGKQAVSKNNLSTPGDKLLLKIPQLNVMVMEKSDV